MGKFLNFLTKTCDALEVLGEMAENMDPHSTSGSTEAFLDFAEKQARSGNKTNEPILKANTIHHIK